MDAVDPFTLELHGAMVQPGLLVRPWDQEGAALADAVLFIHCFQVIADEGREPTVNEGYGPTSGLGTGTLAEMVPVTEPFAASASCCKPSITVNVPFVETDPPIFAVDWNRTLPAAKTEPST